VPLIRSHARSWLLGLHQEAVEELVLAGLELGDPLLHLRPVTGHRIGVPLGVLVLPVAEGGLGHQGAQTGVVGGLRQVRELLVGHGELLPQLLEARRDLGEAALDQGSGHSRQSTLRRVRLPPVFAALAALALLLAACGDDGDSEAGGACDRIRREALDPAFLVHVLSEEGVRYTSDPPTSGPHQPTPPVEGVVTEPLPRPVQVGVLERGDVLLQHRPDLPADQEAELEALAGPGVVVAPNPDLEHAVVATAWLHKRTCDAVDVDALREVIEERRGKGPDATGAADAP
jgi:hypothetical protein